MALFHAIDFEGLTPLLDRKQREEPFVVDGKNFLMKVDGPVSAFGKELLLDEKHIADARYIQSIVVNNKTEAFIFLQGVIMLYNKTANTLLPVHVFTEPTAKWPWSYAVVGGLHYFARKGVGLLQWNASTQIWQTITGVDVPVGIVSCTQSRGRLIVGAPGLVAWSTIDDGTDFTTSTATGAGFQALSLISNGEPYAVAEYSQGFLLYTSQGVLKAEAVNTIIPFRFQILSRKHILLTPWALIQVREFQHVFITNQGLFETVGELPIPWQEVFSEYLHDRVLPQLDPSDVNLIRLTYVKEQNWIMLSISEDQTSGIFSKAFVLYNPSQRWGSFDQTHTGFIDVRRLAVTGVETQFTLGVVDNLGNIFKFISSSTDYVFPDQTANHFLYDYHELVEFPVRHEATVWKLPTAFRLTSQNESIFPSSGIYDLRFVIQERFDADQIAGGFASSLAGSYLVDSTTGAFLVDSTTGAFIVTGDNAFRTAIKFSSGIRHVGVAPADLEKAPLNARILIGPFRLFTKETTDELSRFLNLSIGMLDTGIDDEFIDWQLDFSSEFTVDWAALAEETVDWGIGASPGSIYETEVTGTLDGYTVWEENNIRQFEVPTLVKQTGKQKQMSCDITGLYNLIHFTANEIDQSFALKTIDINIQQAGVLL